MEQAGRNEMEMGRSGETAKEEPASSGQQGDDFELRIEGFDLRVEKF